MTGFMRTVYERVKVSGNGTLSSLGKSSQQGSNGWELCDRASSLRTGTRAMIGKTDRSVNGSGFGPSDRTSDNKTGSFHKGLDLIDKRLFIPVLEKVPVIRKPVYKRIP